MELEMCGDFLLFLWMEDILTDAEYYRAEERFNKKMADRKTEPNLSDIPNSSTTEDCSTVKTCDNCRNFEALSDCPWK